MITSIHVIALFFSAEVMILQIVCIPVRANVNLKSMTIEEFSGQKKHTHLSSFRLLIEEVRIWLNENVDKDKAQQKWKEEDKGMIDCPGEQSFSPAKLVEKIIQDCEEKLQAQTIKDFEDYNDEYFYRERVNEML